MTTYWLFALIPFLGGLALTAVEARTAFTEHVARSLGRRAEGVVTDHVASREGTYPTLHLVVRWTDDDGSEHEYPLPDTTDAHRIAQGTRVHLRHLPGAPESVVLDSPDRYRTAVLGMWLGVLLWAGTLTAVLIRIATLLPAGSRYRF
ncbi:DUF3592 domain-containing protein [Streptomyces sp. SID5910]|uniref:DUF3592 domain-containing protein n=1 Tax=Streptomyces sp. SID5910 TaxID=2690312 RepID=UPI00136A10F7|nr:DUF3592 domain-containing protein [Streptomyces sp. SID5910]MYR41353.1 DUF3592 domain-containing protein [Streptomyces sp. SID5910]